MTLAGDYSSTGLVGLLCVQQQNVDRKDENKLDWNAQCDSYVDILMMVLRRWQASLA